MVRHVGRQEAIGVFKPGFVLGRERSLTHAATGLCLHGGAASSAGGLQLTHCSLLGALPSQAFKTRRSFLLSAQGGRWSHSGAVRVMPAPAPAQHTGWDAKPCEIATRPHVHFSRFWDQSLTLGAL